MSAPNEVAARCPDCHSQNLGCYHSAAQLMVCNDCAQIIDTELSRRRKEPAITNAVADIAALIVRDAMPATASGATCFVPRYQIDRLRDSLASERSAPPAPAASVPDGLTADDVQWIVNDNAELGVMIHGNAFFLYKGDSLVYADAKHDDGTPMYYRTVGKREFGECAHPINHSDYSKIGTVSLDDSDRWQLLPPTTPEPPHAD